MGDLERKNIKEKLGKWDNFRKKRAEVMDRWIEIKKKQRIIRQVLIIAKAQ